MLDRQHASGIIMVQAGSEEQVRSDGEEGIKTAERQMEAPSLASEQAANTAKAAEGQPEIDEEEAAIEAG